MSVLYLKKMVNLWCSDFYRLHRKKKVREFLVPSQDVTTKLSLGGNNDVINELFLVVSDIPAGDGKLVNLFFTVYVFVRVREGKREIYRKTKLRFFKNIF